MKDPYEFLLAGADEEALRKELLRLAEEKHLEYSQDQAGNILIRKPAENYPTKTAKVLLQGSSRQAIAFMCEAVANPPKHCPALELLVNGICPDGISSLLRFDFKQLESRYMFNLDGTTERYVVSSCSGLVRLIFDTDIYRTHLMNHMIPVEVRIFGLRGGHSAQDIQVGGANAIKLIGEFLFGWYNHSIETQLVEISGGSPFSGIPAECCAKLWIRQDQREDLDRGCWWFGEDLAKRYGMTDPGARIEVRYPDLGPETTGRSPMSMDETGRILSFLNMAPNGVISMDPSQDQMIETFCNMRMIVTNDDRFEIEVAVRSFDDDQKDALREKWELIAEMNRLNFRSFGDFPSWKHKNESDILDQYCKVYSEQNKEYPETGAIHSENACMVIVEAIPGMDAISIGVDQIDGNPDPRSMRRVWKVLLGLVEAGILPERE